VPLPPYIHTPIDDPERYQTIYATEDGSVAAPTAGLHFTDNILNRLRERGIEILVEIPDDRKVAEAYARGDIAVHVFPKYRELFRGLLNKVRDRAGELVR